MNLYLGKKSSYTQKDQQSHLLFENPNNNQLRENFDSLMSKMHNPFSLMQHWLKFEILELQAIMEAFETRNAIEKKLRDCVKSIRDKQEELKTLQEGGFSFGSFFKSKDMKQRTMNDIQA